MEGTTDCDAVTQDVTGKWEGSRTGQRGDGVGPSTGCCAAIPM